MALHEGVDCFELVTSVLEVVVDHDSALRILSVEVVQELLEREDVRAGERGMCNWTDAGEIGIVDADQDPICTLADVDFHHGSATSCSGDERCS